MTRRETAMENFKKGYNCSQAIMNAFMDVLPVQPEDEQTLMKLSSAFGGGMGRLREVCGSVTGMFMVAGMLYGYDGPETGTPKAELYARIQELAKEFEKTHGSIVCREMLGLNVKHDSSTPEKRTDEYYKRRPCVEIIGDAAQLLDDYIKANPL